MVKADSENDTIWATQDQIAKLFDTTKQNIGQHLKNIFLEGELLEKSVVKDSFTTAGDGKKYRALFYNLDAIIAVGYRVNSKKATQFRIWAAGILRDHVLEGYSLNHHKLSGDEDKIDDIHDALDAIGSGENPGKLKGKIILKVTKEFI